MRFWFTVAKANLRPVNVDIKRQVNEMSGILRPSHSFLWWINFFRYVGVKQTVTKEQTSMKRLKDWIITIVNEQLSFLSTLTESLIDWAELKSVLLILPG